MPRKSSRLQSLPSKKQSPASRKRKHEGDEEQVNWCYRKHHMEHRNNNSSSSSDSSPEVIFSTINDSVPEIEIHTTPESVTPERSTESINEKFRTLTCSPSTPLRSSPLPFLYWADSREVWRAMVRKDQVYCRESNMMSRHPALVPRMRSILLDWLIEVCEVYRLHRDSFYLAVDFVDRYLSSTTNVAKNRLQLIGITALFMSTKMEEIYPPKLGEFAYVTDEACTEAQILEQELVMLQVLNFKLCPSTIIRWLNLYMQLHALKNKANRKEGADDSYKKDPQSFLLPQYSPLEFVKTAKLLDLVTLDIGCLEFKYSILAAAALSFNMKRKDVLSVCGYKWSEISPCVSWMTPFAEVVKEDGAPPIKTFSDVALEQSHNIQTHVVTLKLWEQAVAKQKEKTCSTPSSSNLLTPPKSTQKPSKRSKIAL